MEGICVTPVKRVLHAGCGRSPLPAWLSGCIETRLDIDPEVKPDVLASLTNMGQIGPFDAVLCLHALEHVYDHEVSLVLSEFRRVLCSDGYAFIIVPDLEDVLPTDDVLFVAPGGPVAGLDLIYGMRSMIEKCPAMAHKTGFTEVTLKAALSEHFQRVMTKRLGTYNLLGVGACAH